MRILFAFAWLFAGGEQTELRLLARHLNPQQYQLAVVACLYKADMPERPYEQLHELGIEVDTTPYHLSREANVAYLAHKIPNYDLVITCQDVPEVLEAYEQLIMPPPLIEYGAPFLKVLAGANHLVSGFQGGSSSTPTFSVMAYRPRNALNIPSMVDMAEYDPARRAQERAEMRAEWGLADTTPVIGYLGRLDRNKRVEDFIEAAACVQSVNERARFVIIGGPDAIVPEYVDELRDLANRLGLENRMYFLGDRADVPRLLAGLDIFVWLSQGEGVSHVVAEAGAARLPVIIANDNGATDQVRHGETALFVPPQSPGVVAASIVQLLGDRILRRKLGQNLLAQVERDHSTQVLIPRWRALFDEVAVKDIVLRGVFAY